MNLIESRSSKSPFKHGAAKIPTRVSRAKFRRSSQADANSPHFAQVTPDRVWSSRAMIISHVFHFMTSQGGGADVLDLHICQPSCRTLHWRRPRVQS